MKTRTFSVNQSIQPLSKCKIYLREFVTCWPQFRSSCSSLASRFSSSVVQIKTLIRRVLAGREVASHVLTAMALSITVNLRAYLGWCVVGISPLAACVHMWMDRNAKIDGWYHESNFHLFMLLGPYLFCLCVLLGVYMIIPQAKERSIKVFKKTLRYQTNRLLCYPIGFVIGKLIWLYNTTSNDQYWDLPALSIFAGGVALAYLTLTQIDYWTWRKFHALDGIVTTLEGLYNSPLDSKQKVELAKPFMQELKEFNSKY